MPGTDTACDLRYMPTRVLCAARTYITLLAAYELAVRCPVLTQRMVLPGWDHRLCYGRSQQL
eukprot:3940321-Rhodomonas_salina.8